MGNLYSLKYDADTALTIVVAIARLENNHGEPFYLVEYRDVEPGRPPVFKSVFKEEGVDLIQSVMAEINARTGSDYFIEGPEVYFTPPLHNKIKP